MAGSITIEVKDATTGLTGPVTGTSNAANVVDMAVHPGEDAAFDFQRAGFTLRPLSLSADGQIGAASAGYYGGYLVTTALSAAVINVRDAISAGSGAIIDTIAASALVGVQNRLPMPVFCPIGVYADFAGTGTVTFFYWQG